MPRVSSERSVRWAGLSLLLVLVVPGVACGSGGTYPEPPADSFEPVALSINLDGTSSRVAGARVERSFFGVGVAPLLGRLFIDEEYEGNGGAPVILSEPFWSDAMGGEPEVVGRSLEIDGRSHRIVGVMPSGFDSPPGAQFWIVGPTP